MHTYLYKATEGLGPLNEWTAVQLSEIPASLGPVDMVKASLNGLFANLQWQRIAGSWCGGHAVCQLPYIDITLSEDAGGLCRFIVFNKPDHFVLQRVMHSFGLNYACTPENGKLVVPQEGQL